MASSRIALNLLRPVAGPSRTFATAANGFVAARSNAGPPPSVPTDGQPATLHLKSGQKFTGRSFGAAKSVFGETVFSTSITSYTESMTDPSYMAQMLVFTTPMIGNYGVPQNDLSEDAAQGGPRVMLESEKIQCAAVIVSDVSERFSHYQAVESLSQWCNRHGIPGITGVDTRAITVRRDWSALQQLTRA